jgi:hypothetical protein
MVTAYLQEAPILLAVVADEDRLHRGLRVVVDAARSGTPAKGEGAFVRVEHHLLRLMRMSPPEYHPAMAQTHVRDLHGHRHATHQDNLVSPVELVGLPWRDESGRRLARVFSNPGPRVAANRVIAPS